MRLRDFDVIEEYKPLGGGWRYIQILADGTYERIPLQGNANSAGDLVKLVRDFRATRGYDIETVESDIAEYIKRVSPINDKYKGKKELLGKVVPQPFVALIYRMRAWLEELAPKKPELVDIDEATERAEICRKCPQNIKWKINCSECNAAVEYQGLNLRNRPSFPLDDCLLGCRIHGTYLPAFVFIDRESLPASLPTQPAHCWVTSKP